MAAISGKEIGIIRRMNQRLDAIDRETQNERPAYVDIDLYDPYILIDGWLTPEQLRIVMKARERLDAVRAPLEVS